MLGFLQFGGQRLQRHKKCIPRFGVLNYVPQGFVGLKLPDRFYKRIIFHAQVFQVRALIGEAVDIKITKTFKPKIFLHGGSIFLIEFHITIRFKMIKNLLNGLQALNNFGTYRIGIGKLLNKQCFIRRDFNKSLTNRIGGKNSGGYSGFNLWHS